ncbi:MAG: hypothetical protein E7554_07085 [Ruminococcaceae bacterium]|nr:hypothetical protein [Oscillospiraceae bacterium]
MDYRKLKNAAEKITLPEEARQRIAKNCRIRISENTEEHTMNKSRNTSVVRKSVAVFAVLAICLTLSVTALAATGVLQGYFRDITDWRGAIVGIAYENADDEINMSAAVSGEQLVVTAAFVDAEKPPFLADSLGIAEYTVTDDEGNVVMEGAADASAIVDGEAVITIDLSGIESGSYSLTVTSLVAEKKADQPMNVYGVWTCAFTK